jgi:hypothetical protein
MDLDIFIYGYIMDTKKEQKEQSKFICNLCDFKCCKKYNFERHQLTDKHKWIHNVSKMDTKKRAKEQNEKYNCECGKEYKYSQGLSKHKKNCAFQNSENNGITNDVKILSNLVLEVVKQNKELISQNNETQKQNQELQKQVIELCKNGTNNTTITNSNNILHTKTFNLNVFLNERCKDAMNISDFVDSLKLQLSDLESVGKLGFVEGISNIIVKNLKALDIHKRPVHCSDSKREVMYIKDENKWEKENEEKNKLRKAIKRIAHKNSRLLPQFKEKHPDCRKSDSPFSDQYNKLIIEAMGGSGNEDIDNENKIIKNIAKEVIIDKKYEDN